ncbi:MAG: hypothetical protein Q4F28_14315 [Eubacteriales bacterium]|nr:hypothetical protein [Eubacteriales bacterium]
MGRWDALCGTLDNKWQNPKKLSKIMGNSLISGTKSAKNEAVWTIKADFRKNCPKIRKFWIIEGRF